MKKYDKTVIQRRMERRRGQGSDRMLNLFLMLFTVGAVILAIAIFIAFMG